jgi:uncharacterized membrane protein
MAHHDHAAHGVDISLRTKRITAAVSATLAVVILIGMLVIGFGTDVRSKVEGVLVEKVYDARVTKVHLAPCSGTTAAQGVECRVVRLQLRAGPDKGESRTLEFPVEGTFTKLGTGDRIVVSYAPGQPEGSDYQYSDRQRRPVLLMLTVLFAAAVIALGRMRGVAALAGLAVSLVIVLTFVLPAVLEGHDPVVVAVIGSAAIAYIALYIAHGFNALTTVALLGTLASLALIIVLSSIFTAAAHFSGLAGEEASVLPQLATKVDFTGLILAGIVIGALGALDDVTVTQASAVAELKEANPSYNSSHLYSAAVRIGRDHIASTVNTLALAYAGAALPLLLLFLLSRQSLGTVSNSEVVAIEIVRTLVGSIGLVAAVPVTTWLAAVIVAPTHRGTPRPRRRVRAPQAREASMPTSRQARRKDWIDPDRDFWE